ncbi:hypothetical protein A3E14_02125 [Candidatus Curtissbacteria bacterium RIFCSPHIGHO2_12_FULL_41_13]|nr:MAG: hypothetical protein A3E14_02125 [Candidatus Curtissbacteria bacterium RIFCSPHIGHO2_12_FULL_41_13]
MAVKGPKKEYSTPKIDILGVKVDDITFEEAVERIIRLSGDKRSGHYVVTVNSEFVMLARHSRQFFDILAKADLALPDGAGIVFSKRIFGGKVQERIAGVDLVSKICARIGNRPVTVGFLGGFENVAEIVAKRQIAKYPGLKVVIAKPGDPSIGYDLKLKKMISAVGRVDILFVAYGMGQQEFWIGRNRNRLNIGVFIGVGGAFDYLSMVKKRAPSMFQRWGVEWLWRLWMEPTRIVRMRVLPVFLVLILLSWISKNLKSIT